MYNIFHLVSRYTRKELGYKYDTPEIRSKGGFIETKSPRAETAQGQTAEVQSSHRHNPKTDQWKTGRVSKISQA